MVCMVNMSYCEYVSLAVFRCKFKTPNLCCLVENLDWNLLLFFRKKEEGLIVLAAEMILFIFVFLVLMISLFLAVWVVCY